MKPSYSSGDEVLRPFEIISGSVHFQRPVNSTFEPAARSLPSPIKTLHPSGMKSMPADNDVRTSVNICRPLGKPGLGARTVLVLETITDV